MSENKAMNYLNVSSYIASMELITVCVFRRQNMETEFLQRRVELLQSENHCNREDIARLTGELANKVSTH